MTTAPYEAEARAAAAFGALRRSPTGRGHRLTSAGRRLADAARMVL